MLPITTKLSLLIPDNVLQELDGIIQSRTLSETQICCFLAQCAHESGNFTITRENMNYSAERLLEVFPKYFNQQQANEYAHNPRLIGNRVYANRMGNGDENSGDGFDFRGRGFIQLTGRDNYAAFDKRVPEDIISNPDLVATQYPLASAIFFFDMHDLWKIAADVDKFTLLTRSVNGGLNGLKERQVYLQKYLKAIQ